MAAVRLMLPLLLSFLILSLIFSFNTCNSNFQIVPAWGQFFFFFSFFDTQIAKVCMPVSMTCFQVMTLPPLNSFWKFRRDDFLRLKSRLRQPRCGTLPPTPRRFPSQGLHLEASRAPRSLSLTTVSGPPCESTELLLSQN